MNLLARAAALLSLVMTTGAFAQQFPSKPIRVVIPFVAGGSSDIVGPQVVNKGGIKPD